MGAAEPLPATPRRHPLFERVLQTNAPEALRLGAARGALPLPLHDLVALQVRLQRDPSKAVATAAVESLGRLPDESLIAFLSDPGCDVALIDFAARSGRLKGEGLAAAIFHPAVGDTTLEALATEGDAEALGLVLINEMRLIRNTRLLAILRANPRFTGEQRRRLAELEREVIGREPRLVAVPKVVPDAPAVEASAVPDATEALPADPLPPPNDAELPPEGAADPNQEYFDEEALQKTDAYQKIQRLNVAERNLLAMKGNAEERAILVRDTARVVSHAVLKNPRLSETEIVRFAGMRSIHEDVLRAIASNREWTKGYPVALALVRNPKTPAGLSVQFLARLGTRDLKICAGDKNIPEMVRRQARNLFIVRTQPPKKTFKKAH
ncbi:MAG TPA: hypothetical protein VFD06_01810 [Candidatus Polarisedimenticolia bacterium]|nr:hypothetical protein [Candidatus Polarisedimenticolia bacterium]